MLHQFLLVLLLLAGVQLAVPGAHAWCQNHTLWMLRVRAGVFPCSPKSRQTHTHFNSIASAFLPAVLAQEASAQSSQPSCTARLVRVSCYYDAGLGAIAGAVFTDSNGASNTLCTARGTPGTVIDVPSGSGIESIAVTSNAMNQRVTKMEFRWVFLSSQRGGGGGGGRRGQAAKAQAWL